MRGVVVLLGAGASVFADRCNKDACHKEFQQPAHATFDLSALCLPDSSYKADDAYLHSSDTSRPFSYVFNVCGNADQPNTTKPCIGGTDGVAAYQTLNLTTKGTECYTLGTWDQADPDWTYISGDDAAVGIQLMYSDGADCKDVPNRKRSFIIEFSCVHELSALPPITSVHEDSQCIYKLTMESIWGCPLECHTGDHQTVCGGHGICAVDSSSKKSRCFCNTGKGGKLCTEDVDTDFGGSSKATNILIAIVVLMLMALFGLAGILYVRIKKLNSDDNPYGAFNENAKSSDGL